MTQPARALGTDFSRPSSGKLSFYYGWIILSMAAIAMVATLPGRSVGIGLITEPLLADLNLSRASFGQMNFWATLIGAAFNFFCGQTLDRFGARSVSGLVLLALGLVVLVFSKVAAAGLVLALLILMRGLGQSALSVVSLTMIGKWFVRRLSIAMGILSVIISIAFAVLILVMQQAVAEHCLLSTTNYPPSTIFNPPSSISCPLANSARSISGYCMKQSAPLLAF